MACLLRLAAVAVLRSHHNFSWGVNEPAHIASAMVQGKGFSSAFHDAAGPTAWLAPIYPAALACIFYFFGIETPSSAAAAVLLNVVFSSLTAVVIAKLGRERLSQTAGSVAGWAWALAPPLLVMPWLLWETCLSGLILTLAFAATLRLGPASRPRDWAWCGAGWSFAGLLNPAMLAPLAALTLEAAVRTRRWKRPVLLLAVCMVGVLPWTVRNDRVLGRLVPIRSNFWPEVYFGNVDFSFHPTGDSMLYQREGEMRFAADLRARTIAFVRSHPWLFLRLTGHRIGAFWTGTAGASAYPFALFLLSVGGIVQAARRGKRWLPFAAVLGIYPAVYYITYTFARYRYPIEPLMYLLAGFFLATMFPQKRPPSSASAEHRTSQRT